MSHIHTGQLTAARQWAKLLRPWGKRDFWKRERKQGRFEGRSRLAEWTA